MNKQRKTAGLVLRLIIIVLLMGAVIAGIRILRREERDPFFIMRQYVDQSGNQAMFYTIRNQLTGELVVIDGGWPENTENVRHVLEEYGNHVDAWILTHFHNDHACAFNEIYADPQGITIDKIYAPAIDQEKLHDVAEAWDFPEVYDQFLEETAGADNIVHPKRGETVQIAGLTLRFFNTYDETVLEEEWPDIPNNCSLMFRVEAAEEKILFCADCHGEEISEYMIDTYGDLLQADYVQPGHHGNNSMTEAFYDQVAPQIALFDAPEWLMEGEEYKTRELRQYFQDRDVMVYDYTSGNHEFMFR